MKTTNFLNIIFVFLIAGFLLIGCNSFGDPIIGAKGKVTDADGNPLAGVTVTIEKAGAMPRKKITETDGLYEVSLIGAEPKETKISFVKDGYKTVEKGFEKEGKENYDVTLEIAAK